MPYACAHPAAVIALAPALGRLAVPSALAIGSAIPDAWYFLPYLKRADSHSALGLALFCLPAGLFVYAAFHLIFKQPLLALLPRGLGARAAAFACTGLPPVPWRAVLLSLLAGSITHYVWDAFTHPGALVDALRLNHRLFQHGSTVLGTAFVAGWLVRKLSLAPRDASRVALPTAARSFITVLFLALLIGAFCTVILLLPGELHGSGLRSLLRAAGITSVSVLGLALLAYCLLFRSIWARASRTGRDQREPM